TEPSNQVTATESAQISQIQGRLDAIEGRRVFGWVWDRTRPTERLLIRILLEGRMVTSATADMARVDLRRAGIGDGSHAFEAEIPDSVVSVSDNLSVVAVSPSTGEEVVLRPPNQDERAVEAAL